MDQRRHPRPHRPDRHRDRGQQRARPPDRAGAGAPRGAAVVLAVRDEARGATARGVIRQTAPAAEVLVRRLDLADLASVRSFADALAAERDDVDILVNNAGLMAVPRATTADGFERQLGTNHLGHFALTGLLLPLLLAGAGARVVTVSSGVAQMGAMRFDDLQGERRYQRWRAYAQSKLANQLFAYELDRRARAAALRADERGRPPWLRRHQPPGHVGLGQPDRRGDDEHRQRPLRPVRRRRRPPAAVRGHGARRAGWGVLRPVEPGSACGAARPRSPRRRRLGTWRRPPCCGRRRRS